jgi:hypothetical protein
MSLVNIINGVKNWPVNIVRKVRDGPVVDEGSFSQLYLVFKDVADDSNRTYCAKKIGSKAKRFGYYDEGAEYRYTFYVNYRSLTFQERRKSLDPEITY